MELIFDYLPYDIISDICMLLSYEEITTLYKSSSYINNLMYNDNSFWKQKFIHDYGNVEDTILWNKDVYKNYGKTVSFGNNNQGQLGLGDKHKRIFPIEISNIKVKTMACGHAHTIIIDFSNNIWSFGNNNYGQLGLGHTQDIVSPTQILGLKAFFVSCGSNHTVIIDINNDVWSFGVNDEHQLGLNDIRNHYAQSPYRFTPTQIIGIKAKSVSCGYNHTIITDINDSIFGFGCNHGGELGFPNGVKIICPTLISNMKVKSVSCGSIHSIITDFDNNVYAFGELGKYTSGHNLTLIPNIKAKSVSCRYNHVIIIDLDDNVLTCGSNTKGQLGLGDILLHYTLSKVPNIKAKHVSCGFDHSIIIDLNDNVLGFGNNETCISNFHKGFILNPLQIPGIKGKNVICGYEWTIITLNT